MALKKTKRNLPNLAKVEAYYKHLGIPFGPEAGFSLKAAERSNRKWVLDNREGVVPGRWLSKAYLRAIDRYDEYFYSVRGVELGASAE